ncbi:GNAT family protein [Pseudoalteromonas sp. BDTF-M6]|uniref:GNAT family N-acetyltransferase n=1 Tax=Pseudoalteromonas sp. BDTF-M6 TaxID=2796132 RepID=UPI001BB0CDF7|nr:GNAT family protein [Pseudoalteromonas sp. BDTF-M6]MBS3796249.1 GNAT family N-acetyltransferase [Pseudoalteromonas sp. BDTF-M6]
MRLRSFRQADTDALVTMLNDANVQRFLSPKIPFPYTQEDALWWVNEGSKAGLTRAVEVDGALVGCIGALPGEHEYQRSAEVGYWFGKAYWGKGYAQSALNLLIKEVQAGSDWVRLHASVFDANRASSKVLSNTGFIQEGRLHKAIYKNGQFFDALIYAKLIKNQVSE